ncbi:hypothetical protein [Flavobacterium sp.]|uniref:hypothetical protein n=1 Tax=Flavobacterium sp. TaxID=239 RepID=UPI003C6645D2
MLNQAPTQEATLVGGWSPFHPLTTQDQEIFNQALQGFLGVIYTPNAVSTQIVAGKNYRYKCTASMPPSDVIWEAIVEIYAPLTGKPHITGITRI